MARDAQELPKEVRRGPAIFPRVRNDVTRPENLTEKLEKLVEAPEELVETPGELVETPEECLPGRFSSSFLRFVV